MIKMATSSITKNFVVSGEEQIERFADAIEKSYMDSKVNQQQCVMHDYREISSSDELSVLLKKWAL